MAREKAIRARLLTINGVSADTRVATFGTVGAAGTISSLTPNLFSADVMWDSVAYVLGTSVDTAGGCSITIEGTVGGVTGVPIAAVDVPAGSSSHTYIPNLCNSPCSPIPTHVSISNLQGTTEIYGEIDFVAKTTKGEMANGPTNQHRVIEGTLINVSNFAADATHDLTRTVIGATWASYRGLDKATIWDNAMFFAYGTTITGGSWSVAIVGTIGGKTITIAEMDNESISATTSQDGKYATGEGAKAALSNYFYGCCPVPSSIILTEGTATGVSELKVVFMAKTSAGGKQRRR